MHGISSFSSTCMYSKNNKIYISKWLTHAIYVFYLSKNKNENNICCPHFIEGKPEVQGYGLNCTSGLQVGKTGEGS